MPDPVLHTERLVLRPLTTELAAALLESPSPAASGFPREQDAVLLRSVGLSGGHASGAYAVLHDGVPIGTVGARGPVDATGDQELGYGLVEHARGQGLATEAVGAVCAQLERTAEVRRLVAQVQPGNSPSMRVLQRLGFVPVAGGREGHQLLARAAPGQPAVRPHLPGRHVC